MTAEACASDGDSGPLLPEGLRLAAESHVGSRASGGDSVFRMATVTGKRGVAGTVEASTAAQMPPATQSATGNGVVKEEGGRTGNGIQVGKSRQRQTGRTFEAASAVKGRSRPVGCGFVVG